MAYTIQSSGMDQVPAGAYSNCKFLGIEEFENDKGKLLRWRFELPDNKGIATAVTGAEKPTVKNRLGKFLCGLNAAPLQVGTSVEPKDFINKLYFVIVTAGEKGTSVDTFSPMAG